MEPLPRFLRFTFIGTGENPSGIIEKTAKKKIMAVSIFWDECARSHYLFKWVIASSLTKWVMKILVLARWTRRQTFSPSYDVMLSGQFRQYDGAFVEGQEISTDCLGVYLVGDYRKKISTFILPQFSGKTAGLYPVLAPDQSVSLVQIQEAGPWRPTAIKSWL